MPKGRCSICGLETELSFEHIPPKAAGNRKSFRFVTGDDLLKTINSKDRDPWNISGLHYKEVQKGFGMYSLCDQCNNNMGSWYANEYVEIAKFLMGQLKREKVQPNTTAHLSLNIYPLRFLKQICSMAMSISRGVVSRDFGDFLLDKASQNFPSLFSIYMYLYIPGRIKCLGRSIVHTAEDSSSNTANIICELDTFPIGFIMFKDKVPKEVDGIKINNLSNFSYDEKILWSIEIPVLTSNIVFPMDYRTKWQIKFGK